MEMCGDVHAERRIKTPLGASGLPECLAAEPDADGGDTLDFLPFLLLSWGNAVQKREITSAEKIAAQEHVHPLMMHGTEPVVIMGRLIDTAFVLNGEWELMMRVSKCGVLAAH